RGLFFGARPEAYLGVRGHGSFAYWALPLALIGLGLQGWRRRWLWVWLLVALLALASGSVKFEPQRSIAALVPLCLAAGFGWRWLCQQGRLRRWAALLSLALPLLGYAY